MASLGHGSIGPFDTRVESWMSYTERLEQYFLANDIRSEEKRRAILLSICGPQTYELLKNLVAPDKPATKAYADITSTLTNHYQPKPSIIVQRFMFHSRAQKQGEAVADFVAELHRLADNCGFDGTLNDMLRDRLVCGIADERVQRRLLAETTLTFKKAFDLAQASEAAERNLKELKAEEQKIMKVSREMHHGGDKQRQQRRLNQESKTASSSCYRCGDSKHRAADCRFKTVCCHNCGKMGHLAKVCKGEEVTGNNSPSHQKHRTRYN